MKDKKLASLGKSYNLDGFNQSKKVVLKEASPIRNAQVKNKMYASNDFESDRKNLINKVMSINMNVKTGSDPSLKSKYFLSNNNKNTLQQIFNSKETFIKTDKGGFNNSPGVNGLRSSSQNRLKAQEDAKYKMPNITSHMFNISPPKKTVGPISSSNKDVNSYTDKNYFGSPNSPLKQSGANLMKNDKKNVSSNVASLTNRNAFLQQLKKEENSPKLKKDPRQNSGREMLSPGGNNIPSSNSGKKSPLLSVNNSGGPLNTQNSNNSLNNVNANTINTVASPIQLKEILKHQKNDSKAVTPSLNNQNLGNNLNSNKDGGMSPFANSSNSLTNSINNTNLNSMGGSSTSAGKTKDKSNSPNQQQQQLSKITSTKRGTLVEADKLGEILKEKFKFVDANHTESDGSENSDSDSEEIKKQKQKQSNQQGKDGKEGEKERDKEKQKEKARDKEKEKEREKEKEKEHKSDKNELIKMSYAKSAAGANEDKTRKTNQDSYICKTNVLGLKNFGLFSVFDGHGTHGHFISSFMRSHLFAYYSNKDIYGSREELKEVDVYTKLKSNNFEIVKRSYLKADNELRSSKFETDLSGTTAVSVLIVGNKVICFNCGDSRAIMVNEKRSSNKDVLVPVQLSRDQKPDLPEEKERIIRSGGQVNKLGDDDDDIGPFRVWVKGENYPGLAMSRSIGDFAAKSVGVIADPEILEFEITSDTKFIVLASDGVWEFLSNKQVMDIVSRYYKANEIQKAADKVIEESTRYWKEEDEIIDDITCVIVFF